MREYVHEREQADCWMQQHDAELEDHAHFAALSVATMPTR